ncbi:MAG: TRAM domain-containing protein [Chitinophagales bacterium]
MPLEDKEKTINRSILLQNKHSLRSNKRDVGKVHKVLVERVSKKSEDDLSGRNDQYKMVVFPKGDHQVGDYVDVLVTDCTGGTLIGEAVN